MVNFNQIAIKWQKKWEEKGIFTVKENPKKKKYYVLEMYPYPSGSGLHMGHARNYCIGDVYVRFKRMQGFNVLYPMGYDSFGLPAENAAIEAKSHPKIFIENAIKNFIRQQKSLGLSYDWSRMFACHDPEFYKWDQWIFLKMYEKGLAYKKKSPVKWCRKCRTVLANEQVHEGKCWRHKDTEIQLKNLNQWFFKITDYAEELLQDIEELDWNEEVKIMQRNWIGKSEGVKIFFKLDGSDKVLPTYTTRCDTIYSVTFLVLAPEHPLVLELVKGTKYEHETKEVLKKISKQSEIERTSPEGKDKIGCFLGKYAINPANGERIPIYVANFVMMYGTGIVMADAHDQRDFEFAKKYNISLKFVISKDGKPTSAENADEAYIDDGILFNSGKFSGMHNKEALPLMADWIEKQGYGKKTVNYKLRDWLVSRQRFWGTPIPIIYCKKCGMVTVPEKDLPVKLPDDIKFANAKNPLANYEPFVKVKCPKCRGDARRETDTMDTFVNSSWYFLRYCDAKNIEKIFDSKKVKYWMPIDLYIGGKEHACMHLIYFRFYTKFLRDLGLLDFDEPALRLFNQGMLHKEGAAMSKSKGNVIIPEEISEKYGIDTARFFLMFVSSPDKDIEWSDKGIEGSYRFLNKFYALLEKKLSSKKDSIQESKLNKTIMDVTKYISELKYNMAAISLMEMTNYLYAKDELNKEVLEKLVLMLSVFTPHICEEMWSKLGNKGFVSLANWPEYDESKIDEQVEAEEEMISDTISDIRRVLELIKIDKPKEIKLIVSAKWKYPFFRLLKDQMEKTRDVKELMGACINDELKKYGAEISKIIPSVAKEPSKLPLVVLTQEKEFENLKSSSKKISEEFKAEIIIETAEKSSEAKANNSIPSKPAIVVK